MEEGLRPADWEVAEDIEQVLAAEADGLFDLSPATVAWLVEALDSSMSQANRPSAAADRSA